MNDEKKLPTEQEYDEMLQELKNVRPGKEARAFHKKYKKYGWGLFFYDRYPNFSLYVSEVAVVIALVALIVKIATG